MTTNLSTAEQDEVQNIKANIGTAHYGFKRQTTTRVARQIALGGWFTWNGRFIQPKIKSIGAGVYEVWGEEYNP